MSRREAVLLSVFLHVGLFLLLLFAPEIPFVKQLLMQQAEQQQAEIERQQALAMQQQRQQPRFVFVQPKIDMKAARPKDTASLADQDRVAQTMQRAPNATNDQPFSRGNSLEFVEKQSAKDLARGKGPAPEPSESPREMPAQQARAAQPTPPQNQATPSQNPASTDGVNVRDGQSGLLARGDTGVVANPQARNSPASATPAMRPPGGSLGQALKNLEKYVQNEAFNNPNGGNSPFGPYIQFDTKGVEFGPWIRRFVAQIKRNWLIPEAAMVMRGHVVVTFNVHKDGRITDIAIKQPSGIDAFDRAAANSLQWSNPTTPLPPEYPSPPAFFTVTFYYNEQPPSQ
ncbi:TonB family protein [Luteitalea sp. TBR-22]|uniref:TonB family protein n=1 Tax=Luteitalea sp. TBR-22 TaxID=2802971 RepID=UPI001EF598B8|nr:TonB family protein [Luteitalea sp. TBR-22]